MVIGVHSAKFPTEKITENIRQATARYGLRHAVANDASFRIWKAYGVSAWPTLVLIDPDGMVVGSAPGEGNYEALDRAIGRLIEAHAGNIDAKPRITLTLPKEEGELLYPGKLAVGGSPPCLYLSDTGHHRILACDLDGTVRAVYGSGERGLQDGPGPQARFHSPQGLCVGKETLYVSDTENHAIRAVDLKNGIVRTLAGTGRQARWGARGGKALETALNSPWDVLVHGRALIIAMAGSHQIWKLDLDMDEVKAWIGNGRENLLDGSAQDCELAQPSGLALSGETLFIADSESSGIRAFDLKTERLTTLIGTGLFDFGDAEGKGGKTLQHPLAVLPEGGDLIVADTYNHRLKRLDLKSGKARFWLGDGKPGTFLEPSGLALHDGRLYVADTNSHRVLKVDLATGKIETLPVGRPARQAP